MKTQLLPTDIAFTTKDGLNFTDNNGNLQTIKMTRKELVDLDYEENEEYEECYILTGETLETYKSLMNSKNPLTLKKWNKGDIRRIYLNGDENFNFIYATELNGKIKIVDTRVSERFGGSIELDVRAAIGQLTDTIGNNNFETLWNKI
jgi:hypothetical protein